MVSFTGSSKRFAVWLEGSCFNSRKGGSGNKYCSMSTRATLVVVLDQALAVVPLRRNEWIVNSRYVSGAMSALRTGLMILILRWPSDHAEKLPQCRPLIHKRPSLYQDLNRNPGGFTNPPKP